VIDRDGYVVCSQGQRRRGPSNLLDIATVVKTEDVWVCACDIVVRVLACLNQSHNSPVPGYVRGVTLNACERTAAIVLGNGRLREVRSICPANIVLEGGCLPLVEDNTVITDIHHSVLVVIVSIGGFSIHVRRALLLKLEGKLVPVVGNQL